MVLIGVWLLSTNTMGIDTTDFALLVKNSRDEMQMLFLEGGTNWSTVTPERRSKSSSYSIACMLKARTNGHWRPITSWPLVSSSSFENTRLKWHVHYPNILDMDLNSNSSLWWVYLGIQGWEAQGLSIHIMGHVVFKNATRNHGGTTTKNPQMYKKDDSFFGVGNTNVDRKVDWAPLHSTKGVGPSQNLIMLPVIITEPKLTSKPLPAWSSTSKLFPPKTQSNAEECQWIRLMPGEWQELMLYQSIILCGGFKQSLQIWMQKNKIGHYSL